MMTGDSSYLISCVRAGAGLHFVHIQVGAAFRNGCGDREKVNEDAFCCDAVIMNNHRLSI